MPEMPEVEVIRLGLSELIVSQEILDIEVVTAKSLQAEPQAFARITIGSTVVSVQRYGKLLSLNLSNSYTILIHLKMTGQLVYRGESEINFGGGHPTDSLIDKLPDKSTRVILHLSDGTLYFNDQRMFGYLKLVPTREVASTPFIQKLGPEPHLDSPETDVAEFIKRASRHQKMCIKAVLLNQEVVAGIGNIYADETLWLEQLHPTTQVSILSQRQLRQSFQSAAQIMQTSINHGGSTSRNYVNATGKRGVYLDFANVYGRTELPCHRCGTLIVKIRVASRGTHICPKCQHT